MCVPSHAAGTTGSKPVVPATHVACASVGGRILTFEITELKTMANGGRGLMLIDLEDKDQLAGAAAYTRSIRLDGIGRGGKVRDETLEIRSLNNARAARGRKGRRRTWASSPTPSPAWRMLLRAANKKSQPLPVGFLWSDRIGASSAISSISTQAPMGIWATPKALRACNALVAKHLAQQLAGAVGHQVLLGEVAGGVHQAHHLTMRLMRLRSPPVAACSVPFTGRWPQRARPACLLRW